MRILYKQTTPFAYIACGGLSANSGGEGGIRTLGSVSYTHLAGVRLKPTRPPLQNQLSLYRLIDYLNRNLYMFREFDTI